MNPFIKKLDDRGVLISDGATGTNLQKMGLKAGTLPEELVLDDPDILLTLATKFVEAGSDIILTCTFGGTSMRMKESKYANRSTEINVRAAELARQVAAQKAGVCVAGSIGPTGALIQPYGPATPEEVSATYTTQIEALVMGGVDLLVIETMFSIDEATLAFEAAQKVADIPIVVSFSYDRGTRTMMGVKPAQVIDFFADNGACAVGANCGTTIENMEKIVQEYSSRRPGFPIWAKPNAGLPRMDESFNIVYDVTPVQMGEAALRYIQSGARVVGGCCGSTPAHVAGIVRAVNQSRSLS